MPRHHGLNEFNGMSDFAITDINHNRVIASAVCSIFRPRAAVDACVRERL